VSPPRTVWERLAGEGIVRLSLPTPFAVGPVNVFLVEDDPLTLVDCGTCAPDSLERLEASLRRHGRALEQVERLLLTHQHVDHMGGAHEVARRSGAEVACLDALATYVEDFEDAVAADDAASEALLRANGVGDDLVAQAMTAARDRRAFGRSVRVDRRLAPSSELRLRDRRLDVLHRPGHSPTDTVFVDRAHGLAFAGDHLLRDVSSNALIGRGIEDGAPARPLMSYRRSLEETRALDLSLVLPGHGEPILDHRALVDARLAEQERRAEGFLALLAGGPRSAFEIASERWGPVARQQPFLVVSEVLGHMDILVEARRALRAVGADGTTVFAPADPAGHAERRPRAR